jgi:hypothetical protein
MEKTMKSNKNVGTKGTEKKADASKSAPIKSQFTLSSPKEEKLAKQVSAEKPERKTIKPKAASIESGKALTTTVEARIDVGFGNALFIRGQGDGLSWDTGTPLECRDGSTWVWSTNLAEGKIVFKLLLNDEVWAQGDDLAVGSGERIETAPVF